MLTQTMKKGEETRALILKRAEALIAERGFSAITLQDILDRAGVTKGCFFHYFDSKENFFQELLKTALLNKDFLNFKEILSQAKVESSFDRLIYLIDRSIEWHSNGLPEAMRLCLFATFFFPPASIEMRHIQTLLAENSVTIAELFKKCQNEYLLPESLDPQVMALMIPSCSIGGNTVGFLSGDRNLTRKNLQEIRRLLILLNQSTIRDTHVDN